ncbi:MAG: 50S ribosomal protein L18 [Candidatus Campbellbacteria bacterium]|nr:50S ribosomal protein L18 [Candidatus Campbellbacteria bacterium]
MKTQKNDKKIRRERRHKKIRSRIFGTAECPRLSFSRTNKHIYLQIIDDEKGNTLAYTSSHYSDASKKEKAAQMGENIARLAKEKKIEKVVFDRSGFLYAGLVKIVADSARAAGLKF